MNHFKENPPSAKAELVWSCSGNSGFSKQERSSGPRACPYIADTDCRNCTLCQIIKHRAAQHGHLCTMGDVLSFTAIALPLEPHRSVAVLLGEKKIH